MRNKGAIILLAVALALVSLYQLSFTYITSSVEKDAEEYAKGDTAAERRYLDSISSETVYDFLFIREYSYMDCKKREINLGLDLKGGMNVILEISVVDVIKSLAANPQSKTLLASINLAKEKQKDDDRDFVTLFGEAFDEIEPGGSLASLFLTPEMKNKIDFNTPNDQVISVIKNETEGAIENSFNILRKRIDRFGVAQPNIQRLETTGRILVELPGIKNPERVRNLLQGTASLEFWETYEYREVYQYLLEANNKIVQYLEEDKEAKTETEKADTVDAISVDTLAVESEAVIADADTTESSDLLSEMADSSEESSSLLEQLESDTTASSPDSLNPENFEKDFPLFSLLRPNVDQQGQLMPGAAVGFAHFKDTSKINKYLNLRQVKSLFPKELKFHWTVKPLRNTNDYYQLVALKVTSRDGKPALGGDVITDAAQSFGQNQASAEVVMQMNAEGTKVWKRLTKDNIGRQIAIVLDGYVYSFPVVQSEIPSGRSSISGGFTIDEAKDLANVLKSGKMPAPATIISEEVVGPSLGHESIQAGMLSFLIAFVVVLIYMIFYYNKAGIVADIALLTNVFFIMGVLASLGAVLTLPGIAGIVLTIGMSVDANVLIYERIREEVSAGKGLKLAVSDGYKNALSAIIDANVTTLLTGVILYIFGTGPIQGFATTLIIGIITSLFSAIFITRLIFEWSMRKSENMTFSTRFTENAFNNLNIKFIEKRKIFYIISSILIVIGIVSLVTRGLSPGVDFTGGRSYVVRFDDNVNTVDIQKSLTNEFGTAPVVKTFGADNQIKVTTKYLYDHMSDSTDQIVEEALFTGLKPFFEDGISYQKFLDDHRMSSYKIESTLVDEMKTSGVMSIIFSLLIIFLYIIIRFKNWQFGLGAIAALFHDVLIILGLFSIFYGILPFSLEIDQAFIAAILTVVGYSINDTVVVFDRIREYLGLYKKRGRKEILNSALNSTISRTFSTSLSTFFVLLSIFIFGGEVIRGFTFALLVGVVVGTYSSLFIASPVVYDTVKKKAENERALSGKKK
ncbi:MAG: protein translocase subunit SecDF [Marinilabiliales bacterium]|nr:MAG: protein translocase subunit SecDF [Marinilabiliales bacterium]